MDRDFVGGGGAGRPRGGVQAPAVVDIRMHVCSKILEMR